MNWYQDIPGTENPDLWMADGDELYYSVFPEKGRFTMRVFFTGENEHEFNVSCPTREGALQAAEDFESNRLSAAVPLSPPRVSASDKPLDRFDYRFDAEPPTGEGE